MTTTTTAVLRTGCGENKVSDGPYSVSVGEADDDGGRANDGAVRTTNERQTSCLARHSARQPPQRPRASG